MLINDKNWSVLYIAAQLATWLIPAVKEQKIKFESFALVERHNTAAGQDMVELMTYIYIREDEIAYKLQSYILIDR